MNGVRREHELIAGRKKCNYYRRKCAALLHFLTGRQAGGTCKVRGVLLTHCRLERVLLLMRSARLIYVDRWSYTSNLCGQPTLHGKKLPFLQSIFIPSCQCQTPIPLSVQVSVMT